MSNADDAADAIKLTLSQIDARLAQKPADDEQKKLLEAKAALALQLGELATQGLDEGAKTIAAAADRLRNVIANANALPFAEYWTKLQDALTGIGIPQDGTTPPTPALTPGGGGPFGGSSATPLLGDRVPIPPANQMNGGLSACTEDSMLKKFGRPGVLTEDCSPATGTFVTRIRQGFDVGPFKVTGLDYAVESLLQVFADVRKDNQQLFDQVKNEGMLCVRARRHNQSHYSNHSWGTAIDIFFGSAGVVDQGVRLAHRGNLLLAPYFNRYGWYWGAGFSGDSVDSMHFELAEEAIAKIPDTPMFDATVAAQVPAGVAVPALANVGPAHPAAAPAGLGVQPTLTLAMLQRLWPKAAAKLLQGIANTAPNVFAAKAINTPLRVAHFMAQISEECGGGTEMVENLNYTAQRLMVVWPSRFPTLESAQPFAGNPKALGDKVYNGRMGNKPGSDDGFNFRGHGCLQLTGRDSYDEIGKLCQLDLVNNPDLAADPQNALLVAATEFAKAGCLTWCDQDSAVEVSALINLGHLTSNPKLIEGFASREVWLTTWKHEFGL